MPTRRVGIILGVALLCAFLASYLVVLYVRKQEQLARAGRVELQPVIIATSDIPIGSRLTTSLVAARSWPKAGVPEGAVSEPEAVLGRLVKGEIARDEPILEHRLFPKGLTEAPGVMSVIIPPGKRAMTVGVNEVIGVSGFILPKNRVDVIATRTDQGVSKSTETILQNIEVLAVGHRLEQKGEQHIQVPTVTMAVSPEEAERLALALHQGKIHIVLRSIMDPHLANLTRPAAKEGGAKGGASLPAKLTRPAAKEGGVKAGAQGGKGVVVDVIRGDKRSLETYAME